MLTTYVSQLSLYFWRRNSRTKAATGKAPISLRIELKGYARAELHTGVCATEAEWNAAMQRLIVTRGLGKEEQQLLKKDNAKLSKWYLAAEQAYESCKGQGGEPSPTDVLLMLRGKKIEHDRTLLAALRLLHDNLAQRGREPATLRGIQSTINTLTRYLTPGKQLKVQMPQIDRVWLRGFERWCLAEQLSGNTIRKHVSISIRAIDAAVDEGITPENKAVGYRYLSEIKKPAKRHLSEREVEHLAGYMFAHSTLQKAKDIFVFCAYTGLAYCDYVRFARNTNEFLATHQGVWGIGMQRQKMLRMSQQFWVPLFPEPLALLRRYANKLPVLDRSYLDKKLKLIAKEVGLSLPDLMHKDARSTFSQMMRDKYGRELSAGMAGHQEAIADKHYSSISPTRIVAELQVLGVALTYH